MTPKMHEALTFIGQYWERHGYAPSYEDIKNGLESRSKSQVYALVCALENRGYITRIPHHARSIKLVSQVLTPTPAQSLDEAGVSSSLPPEKKPPPPEAEKAQSQDPWD